MKSDSRLTLVKSLPTVEAGDPLEFCADEGIVSVIGNATPPGGTYSSPNADVNDALNPTVGIADLDALQPGTYTLEYSITANGCTNTDTKTLTIHPIPEAPDPDDQARCDDGSVSLVHNTTSDFTVKWYENEDDNTPIWTGNVFNTPSLSETTTYYVSLTNEFDCEGPKSSITAIINPLPVVDAGGPITFCVEAIDEDLNQYVNLVPGEWVGPGTTIDGKFNSTNLENGKYIPVYTYTNPITGCSNSDELEIQVGLDPNIFADPQEIEAGNFVSFSSNLANASEIAWDFGDGFTSNELTPIHYYYEAGEFDISITFTLDNDCSGNFTAEKLVTVTDDVEIITSIDNEAINPSLSLFPSPLQNTLYLDNSFSTQKNVSIIVYDLSGKVIINKQGNISKSNNIILTRDDILLINSGIHILQLQFDDFVVTQKLFKQ